jgi:branched-chain amino acid transport system substrate-binding protein
MIDPKRFAVLLVALFAFVGVSASAQTASPYKIGVTWPLTGPLASSGLQYLPGAEVAVSHINRRGGINGHPLQLVVEDTQGSPQGGVAAMRKLVQVDGAQAILSIYTNVVTAQIPLADQLKVPFLCPAQTPGLMSRSPYSFAHAETVSATGGIFARYWKRVHAKKVYALNPNNAIGPVYSAAWKAAAASAGAEYAESSFNYGDNDYRGLVARVKENNPDQIIVSAQGGIDDTVIIRQLREAGVNAKISVPGLFTEEPAWRAGVGTYIDGLVMAGLTIDPVAGKQFIDDYRIHTGHLPGPIAGEVYDMIQMFAAAIAKGGYNGEAIAKQLATLKGVPSVFGSTITMDPEHYSVPSTDTLWLFKNNKLVKAMP